jgi:hypothetical protein
MSRSAPGPTKYHLQWVHGALYLGGWCDADDLTSGNVEVKNERSYISIPLTLSSLAPKQLYIFVYNSYNLQLGKMTWD